MFLMDNITTDLDPDPNWAEILNPDHPDRMYLTIWIHNTASKEPVYQIPFICAWIF